MRRLLAVVAAAFVACAPAGSARSTPTPTAAITTPPSTATASPAPAPREALLTKVFKDVRSGEEFTLGQFSGRVTLVQHMAVW